MFDPERLGWTEFWLRVAILVLGALALAIMLMIVVRVLLLIFDLTCWLLRRRQDEDGSEMDAEAAFQALLSLIPRRSRVRGTKLLWAALEARQSITDGPVYVSEYNGHPSRVHLDATAAQKACTELLRFEAGREPCWDWFADADGWIMCLIDPNADEPGPSLGGRVTRAAVEA